MDKKAMKKAYGKRMRKVLEILGIRQRHFAAEINFSPGYVNDVLQGRTRPSLGMLTRLRTIFNVSPTYIILGEGTMFMPSEVSEIAEEAATYEAMSLEAEKTPKELLRSSSKRTAFGELMRVGHPWISELLSILPENLNEFISTHPSARKQFNPLCAIMVEEIAQREPELAPENVVTVAVDVKNAVIKLFETSLRLSKSGQSQKLSYLIKSLDAF